MPLTYQSTAKRGKRGREHHHHSDTVHKMQAEERYKTFRLVFK